ncbi:MAG TPA: YceH family protein [Ottowia sp.]|uniref:YceH family protein n=1 Tax=Ottowia sp. TaxID=1898956 RepID=UPI002C68E03F|nr:YceH family protein [Ottowia sp.]HMN21610.1 YceH family protein [Ottowia sp.]
MNALRPLTPIEARVLGTLLEKARTVPDTYPLSLNAVVSGCNQRSSREPVMAVSADEAQAALESLQGLSLAIESHGGRVARWSHNLQRVLAVPEQSAVLLGLLLLRGPQTAGELRLNAERWHRFADISSVEGFLHELAERKGDQGGPLTLQLARAPGEREARWAQLLCGPVTDASGPGASRVAPAEPTGDDSASARIDRLEDELAALRATVTRLCTELGLSPAGRTAETAPATNPDAKEIS